jgi:hypothetical protein
LAIPASGAARGPARAPAPAIRAGIEGRGRGGSEPELSIALRGSMSAQADSRPDLCQPIAMLLDLRQLQPRTVKPWP